jgi:predicted RNase H-like HicB family nuclease
VPARSAEQIDMKQNSYGMIIWWSVEDNAYVVEVPELPGCMAHGSTRQEAIKNAEDAIKFWIKTTKNDGLAIPQPRRRLVFA